MKPLLILTLFAIAPQALVFAQGNDSCAGFQQTVKSTYNFKPSRLTEAERNSKSATMDRFWNMVKADPKRLLPCLSAALQDTSADKWFRFDASNLLVGLDPSPASKAIQLRSYADVDLDDVDLRIWVGVLAARGFEGLDVSEPGNRWLSYPKAEYYLPEHGADEVDVSRGALFIFGSMDESQATPALIKILSQPNHPGREHALWILMSQATTESLRALKKVDASAFSGEIQSKLRELLNGPELLRPRAEPKKSREEFIQAFQELLKGDSRKFMELVLKVPDGEKDIIAVLKPEDLPLVRKVRRMVIASANPHAIGYYNSFTDILMSLVWKPELVK
jgi:hypothetical protein